MHILLIHQYFQETDDPGGLRWNAMSKIWAAEGHTVTVIAGMTHYTKGIRNPKYDNKYVHVEQFAPGIKVIRTHVSKSYNNHFRGRLNAYFAFVFSGIYGGLIKAREKYDCIIVSSPPLTVGIIARVLSLFKRIPFIFEIRDLWPESAIDTGVLKNKSAIKMAYRLEKSLYKRSTLINVLTTAMRDTLIDKKGIPESKIIYFPNAADFDISDNLLANFDIKAYRKSLGINENTLALCYVGAHGVANHLTQVLKAADLLKQRDVVFLLIGDGMQKHELIAEAKQKGLTNVLFIDSVTKEAALKYILACDLGLSVLKKAETFKTVYSNKTFDYMACKKPVVLAIDGVSRALVETANAGTFVEPENPQHLAQVIEHYLANKDLIINQGENGYQYAKAHFDRNVLALNYIRAIELHLGKKTITTEYTASRNVS